MATVTTTPQVRKPKAVPDQNPYSTVLLICPTCSQVVLPTIVRMSSGIISEIKFYHSNPETGCAWRLDDPMERSRGICEGLRQSVRVGNDAKGQPKFINEHDLAVGKSFDLDGLKPQDLLPPVVYPAPQDTPQWDFAAAIAAKLCEDPRNVAIPATEKPALQFRGPQPAPSAPKLPEVESDAPLSIPEPVGDDHPPTGDEPETEGIAAITTESD